MSDHRHGVLVIEDDADSRDALGALLELEGCDIKGVSTSDEGLAYLRAGAPPCIIFLDLHLCRGMDTSTFRTEQLADPATAAIPLVLLSGDHDLPARARQLGARGFLQKPIDLDEVVALVGRYCSP